MQREENGASTKELTPMPPRPPARPSVSKQLNVLVACECSGTVRDAFRKRGYNAFSCDLQPDAKGSPYHVQADVRDVLGFVSMQHNTTTSPNRRVSAAKAAWYIRNCNIREKHLTLPREWDIVIAHPPCTHIAVSGARHFAEKQADGRQQEGIEFFRYFTLLNWENNRVRTWAIENPVCIMSSLYRKPDQIIQPWQFGHQEMKKTCLWLNGLPPLLPTKVVGPPPRIADMTPEEKRTWCRIHYMSPGARRGDERSVFYTGFADAMASQWGSFRVNDATWEGFPKTLRRNR